jgi:hypothetical protein
MALTNITIHLPGTERATILAALAAAEADTDTTAAMLLNVNLLAWLRAELLGADVTTRTAVLNNLVKSARKIITAPKGS